MIRKKVKTCIVCGTTYEYCNSCAEFKVLPSWKNIFCEEDCMTAFQTVTDYKAGLISPDEAYSILEPLYSEKFVGHDGIMKAYKELSLINKPEENLNKKSKKDKNVQKISEEELDLV